MNDTLIFRVVPINETRTDSLKRLLQAFRPFFDQQMHVISHQAVGKQLIAANRFIIPQDFKKHLVVFLVLKDLLTVYSPEHDMIDSTFRTCPCFPRHLSSPHEQYTMWNHLSQSENRPLIELTINSIDSSFFMSGPSFI